MGGRFLYQRASGRWGLPFLPNRNRRRGVDMLCQTKWKPAGRGRPRPLPVRGKPAAPPAVRTCGAGPATCYLPAIVHKLGQALVNFVKGEDGPTAVEYAV